MISLIRFYIIIVGIVCFDFHQMNAQPTVLITHDRKDFFEEFDVLESDSKIKHGSYVKIIKGPFGIKFDVIGNYKSNLKHGYWEKYYQTANNLEYSGFFKTGLKDSLWTYYFHQGEGRDLIQTKTGDGVRFEIKNAKLVVKASGSYSKDKRVGRWKFFDKQGNLFQEFDYDNQEMLFSAVPSKVPCNPLLGSEETFNDELFESINFFKEFASLVKPDSEKSTRIIEIEFQVDDNGLPVNPIFKKDELNLSKLNSRIIDSLTSMKWYFNPMCHASAKIKVTVFARNQNSKHQTEKGDFNIGRVATSFLVNYQPPIAD